MKKNMRIALLVLAAALILGFVYFALSGKNAKKEPVYIPGPYSDEQLDQINQESVMERGSLSDLEKTCDVQYVDRTSPEKTAVVAGETQVLVVQYDEDGKMRSQKILSISPASEEFEALSAEDPINSVIAVDPAADYGFLFSGRNDDSKLSYHYTRDGYCIEITYDSNYQITDIVKSKLEDG